MAPILVTPRDGPIAAHHPQSARGAQRASTSEVIAELTAWAATRRRRTRACAWWCSPAPGKAFCAGADLAWMAQGDRLHARARTCATRERCRAMFERARHAADAAHRPRPRRGARRRRRPRRRLRHRRRRRADAVFGFTEVKLGILPAVISPFVLAQDRRVGGARAVPDRRALRRGAGARDRPGPRGRAARRSSTPPSSGCIAELLDVGPERVAAAKALIRDGRRREPEGR